MVQYINTPKRKEGFMNENKIYAKGQLEGCFLLCVLLGGINVREIRARPLKSN